LKKLKFTYMYRSIVYKEKLKHNDFSVCLLDLLLWSHELDWIVQVTNLRMNSNWMNFEENNQTQTVYSCSSKCQSLAINRLYLSIAWSMVKESSDTSIKTSIHSLRFLWRKRKRKKYNHYKMAGFNEYYQW